jgi:hypothetical protein
MLAEPLSPPEVRKLVRQILEDGTVSLTQHARDEMAKDGLETTHVENVLRGGWSEPGEWENGAWRYRIMTARIVVVIEFVDENELVVVTAWRVKP